MQNIMKNKYLIKLGTILLLAVLISSCKKWIDPDMNIDPDSPLDANFNLILPAAQVDMGFIMGGMDIRGINGMWVQHVRGGSRQAATIGKNYNITEADVNNAWNSFYAGFMKDLKLYIDKSGTASPQARGVGKILMAVALGQATDLWGNIPYTQSLLGKAQPKPVYDSQQSIYSTINTLLTDALTDLGTANSANLFPLGSSSNDLIYDGSTTKWIAAARSLRARYALHLSKKGTVNYTTVLADCAAGISNNANDLELVFGTTEANANPLYQFDIQRTDIGGSATFATRAAGDPRLKVFSADSSDANFGSFYGSINSPVPFMTYVETKFIEAEAQLRKPVPSQALANAAYDAAVTASLAKFGVTNATWLTNHTSGVLGNRSIQNIIEAKYIALFMQTEAYNDFRRTGFPVLAPTAGANVPVRYPYPTDERLYNTENVPTGITINSPLWWMTAK